MIGFKRGLLMAGLAALAAIAAHPASAQGDAAANYPNRPIRLIVGFAAGGGNDLFARLVGQKLSENIGQPVIIENKPGAGGRIAVEYVKSQPADGYTIMVAASGQMAIAAAIYPQLSYHPTRDFLPLTMIASFPLILAGPGQRYDQISQGSGCLRQGQSGQVQLRDLLAGLHHHDRAVQAKDRDAGGGSSLQEQQRDDAQRRRREHLVLH